MHASKTRASILALAIPALLLTAAAPYDPRFIIPACVGKSLIEGQKAFNRRNYQEAIRSAEAGAKDCPDANDYSRFHVSYLIGEAYMELAMYPEAVAAFDEALMFSAVPQEDRAEARGARAEALARASGH